MDNSRGKMVQVLRRAAFTMAAVGMISWVDSELLAQGCAMCRSSAQVLGQFSTLNAGILVLGVPPMMILALFLYLAFRQRP